ncbi:hypothetical protein FK220_017860 [Flavobacteriaceae bacterium TP-CH-4]|uniref:Uncharacterized protein n=1 Tax=Pelagihabitans pacificus TaxID=2696054 RepID=A0A967AW14_9FLAO|nr:DUF6452 family protein [Pelagihabitans pacificus]NHF61223.1 hypothetical protein [Pelagihabitans pacificus]
MNRTKLVFSIFLGILCIASCEKDDICVDGDTPLLVIRFYDKDDTTLLKTVPALEVRGLNGSDTLGVIANASLDSIAIPLRVDQGGTSFIFSQNPDEEDETTLNMDNITFNYETRELFVSRACGFIVNYDSLSATAIIDDSLWIEEIRIVTPLVENASSAHVKILH